MMDENYIDNQGQDAFLFCAGKFKSMNNSACFKKLKAKLNLGTVSMKSSFILLYYLSPRKTMVNSNFGINDRKKEGKKQYKH